MRITLLYKRIERRYRFIGFFSLIVILIAPFDDSKINATLPFQLTFRTPKKGIWDKNKRMAKWGDG